MIVVDTNVIAYLLVSGDLTETAEAVLTIDPEWAAPALWRSEMRNLLMLYVRRGAMLIGDAKLMIARAEMQLSGREYDVSSDRVMDLADRSGCTAYDCEFAALAEQLGAPLVTSDKKLLGAFPTLAISMIDFVKPLGS